MIGIVVNYKDISSLASEVILDSERRGGNALYQLSLIYDTDTYTYPKQQRYKDIPSVKQKKELVTIPYVVYI